MAGRYKYTLRAMLLVVAALAGMFALVNWLGQPLWVYDGEFHAVIRNADRIVVRDGGFDWPDAMDLHPILFEIRDPNEVQEVYNRLAFERSQYGDVCGCHGYPGIDWWQGKNCIARTSVEHCQALRWDGFDGDASLTAASRSWIGGWLVRHGVPRNKIE